jgi:hypothetical protein
MDDLTKLESNLEKLSHLFFDSVIFVQKYAPLINGNLEENMEMSETNMERIKVENIQNYKENRESYDQTLTDKAAELNNTFNEINNIIDNIKKDELYEKTEDELITQIKNLRENNESKVKILTEKIRQTDDIINNIKKENEINMHLLRYTNNLDFP